MNPNRKKKIKRAAAVATDAAAITVGGVFRLAVKAVVTLLLLVITTGLLFACIFAYYVKTCLTTELDVSPEEYALSLSSTVWYEGADGQYKELATFYSDENRIWIDYGNIPEYMTQAAIAIEDQRFETHKGVDWFRTVGAFVNMFVSMKDDFGGSTITQQLLKNVTQDKEGTVQRKLVEIFRALEYEKKYTKDEIMEWYLNVIYLGEGCYGVGAAAREYFGKDVWELSLAECASIIGITNNPSAYDPFINAEANKNRQETILYEMYDQGKIDRQTYLNAAGEQLIFIRGEDEPYEQEIYSWYTEAVRAEVIEDLMAQKGTDAVNAERLLNCGGYQIYCCLDPEVQAVVDNIYQSTETLPQSYKTASQSLQSSTVVMDPYTGAVVALCGGTGSKEANLVLNRATDTTRPPGSSFKPLAVYGPAFDLGLITQSTLVNDADGNTIKLSGTNWYTRNSGGYSGIITIRSALINSKNTVSAQILDKLGLDTSFEYLTGRLGLTTLVESRDGFTDVAYAPLSLGQLTDGAKVIEMAQAYTSFVNEGVMTCARTYDYVLDYNGNTVLDNEPETSVAFKSNTARNIADMLKAAVSFGTGKEASFAGMSVAGKTGTTSENKDRWFVGFTPYYVCAVWTGYDIPEYMYYNGNPAAQIWKRIMQPIHAGLEDIGFPAPSYGRPTNIFGDLAETPSPAPTATPSPATPPVESSPATAAPQVSAVPTAPAETAPPPTVPVTEEPTPAESAAPSE